MRIKQLLATILCLALLTTVALAQIGTSTITGRVTDTSGAVVPGVSVTVVQVSTNFKSVAVTNAEGIYRVLSLQPGIYKLTFEAAGFKRGILDNAELQTGNTMAIDMVLQVGTVSETVEVLGTTQLLETETSATGSVVTGSVLYDMPLFQRFINNTFHLVPGVTTSGHTFGGSLGGFSVAGQRSSSIGAFEDGVSINDQQNGTGTIRMVQNAVAEVQVLTTVPPAEYGHSAGGVISVVKKSGTNELHAMGSWYGRTRRMQHRLFYDKETTTQQNLPTLFMLPDANMSGPIYIPKVYDGRNKTFFFFGYQRLHEKKIALVDATTPTDLMKQGNFNFPGVVSNPIFDPATTRNAGGVWQRDPFPGNIIPAGRIDPVARNVIGFDPWMRPNRPGTFNALGPNGNLGGNELAQVYQNNYSLRLDHQFGTALKLYGSYTADGQNGLGRPINIRTDRPEFDHVSGNYTPFNGKNASAGYTYIARPNLVNDSRFGYYRRVNSTQVPSLNGGWGQKLGIPNIDAALMPALGSGDRYGAGSLYGISGATPSRQVNETISFRSDTSWINGRHAIKFGYEVLRFRLNNAILARPVAFSFAGVTTGLQANGAAVPNTGNTFAGFLTGSLSNAVFQSELTSWLPRSSIHSFYIQDDWKVTPTLTANIGLRYSNEGPFNTKYGAMSNFDPNGRDPITGRTGAIVHLRDPLNRRDNNNFNPRVGLAWHPVQKWVLRGGIGMYTVDVKFPQGRGNFDEYTAITNQQALPGDPTPIYQISRGVSPPPFSILPNGTAPFVGANFAGRGASWWDPGLRNPYTLNWNTSLQYELAKDYLLEFSYLGSSGVGLLERWQTNTFPLDFAANDPVLRNQVFAASQNFRPYNQFGDVLMQSNFGHSSYHSGTVKLDKRFSRGFYFNTFYTFSKAIDSQDTDLAGAGRAPIQNRAIEKGRAGFDRTHRYVGVVNYELPFGKGKRWMSGSRWKNRIFGGLELSWIQTIESGNPLTFSFANSPYNYFPGFAGLRRPDIVSKPTYDFSKWDNGGPDRFTLQNRPAVIDMNAFALPGGAGCPTLGASAADILRCSFLVGNAGRGILTGPRLVWAQVALQKNFSIRERVQTQLRFDFQNVLKTYNFSGPTTTVDFRNPLTFGRLTDDPRTASWGGQPLIHLTLMMQF